MPFSKCRRAKKYSNMNVYFDPQGCQTLLLKESDPLLFPLGSWTNSDVDNNALSLAWHISDVTIRVLHFITLYV